MSFTVVVVCFTYLGLVSATEVGINPFLGIANNSEVSNLRKPGGVITNDVIGRQRRATWSMFMDPIGVMMSAMHTECKIPRMTIKNHLSRNSIEPELIPGKIRLYSMRYCPFAQRIHLVLNAKDIPHDPVFINLSDKPEWYLKIFPAGKVPALLYDEKILSDSLHLADFLDEQYPVPSLWRDGPVQKILDKMFIESFGKVTSAFCKLMTTIPELEKSNFDELVASLKPVEDELAQRGSTFFGGDRPQMIDYMIWPWFERFDSIGAVSKGLFIFPFDKFPKLEQWKNAMISDEAVAAYYLPPEKYAQHFINKKTGSPAAFNF